MPIEHRVDPERGLLRVRRWGAIDTHDEEHACRVRAADPLIVPDMPVLVDCREVEPADSTDVVRYLADCATRIAAHLDCGPTAILVSSDIEYGMARMYMAYTELKHPQTQVFRTEEEALDWLAQSTGAR